MARSGLEQRPRIDQSSIQENSSPITPMRNACEAKRAASASKMRNGRRALRRTSNVGHDVRGGVPTKGGAVAPAYDAGMAPTTSDKGCELRTSIYRSAKYRYNRARGVGPPNESRRETNHDTTGGGNACARTMSARDSSKKRTNSDPTRPDNDASGPTPAAAKRQANCHTKASSSSRPRDSGDHKRRISQTPSQISTQREVRRMGVFDHLPCNGSDLNRWGF